MSTRVLVTGGAGFVGSSLALRIKQQHPPWEVTALDNLKRRGSELCLPRLAAAGVRFVHGDVRVADDLHACGGCDLVIECSAEPSVLAGLESSPAYVLQTNLTGAINCLEHARVCRAGMIFLSSSRVYPIEPLSSLAYREDETRFELTGEDGVGVSERGIAEDFPLAGARSIYGATKLSAELLLHEYVQAYGMRAVIDRCGVLTGPWQMGKVDQGVVMHWVASHVFERPLTYIGYGGHGKQVRDILHIDDLGHLIDKQIDRLDQLGGAVFNVGGGRPCSVSLRELTALCAAATGNEVPIGSEPETRPADIPIFLTDAGKAMAEFEWAPRATPAQIVSDVTRWVVDHREALASALA